MCCFRVQINKYQISISLEDNTADTDLGWAHFERVDMIRQEIFQALTY